MDLKAINKGCTLSEIDSEYMNNIDINTCVAIKYFQNEGFEYQESGVDGDDSILVGFSDAFGEYHKIGNYDYVNDCKLTESLAAENGYILNFANSTISNSDGSICIPFDGGLKLSICKIFLMEEVHDGKE